jgi:predicted TPR repeat methyltransferase
LAKGVAMMADIERAGYAQKAAEIVIELPEFPSFRKMLDLGGGLGIIGMAIVDAHSKMKGVIFDLSPVVKETNKFIQEYYAIQLLIPTERRKPMCKRPETKPL